MLVCARPACLTERLSSRVLPQVMEVMGPDASPQVAIIWGASTMHCRYRASIPFHVLSHMKCWGCGEAHPNRQIWRARATPGPPMWGRPTCCTKLRRRWTGLPMKSLLQWLREGGCVLG